MAVLPMGLAMSIDASINTQLFTIRDYIRYGASLFRRQQLYFGHGTDNAWDEAVALVLHALGLPAHSGPEVLDARLLEDEKQAVLAVFERRCDHVPAPYITGEAWFAGLSFYVDERVLIPRSPIAELISQQFSPWLTSAPARILDMCTGSGCIGIACALTFPTAEVVLADIAPEALAVAEINIEAYDLADRVQCVLSDAFDAVEGTFDLIIANPPYVGADDVAALPREFLREPILGLASGDDGLDLTRRLLRAAADYLNESGCLIVEVGNSARHLEQAFPEVAFNWLDFEHGGGGVFVLYREELVACARYFDGRPL